MAKEYLQSVSDVYAKAIFDLAKENSLLEKIGDDLAGISQCIDDDDDFAQFLASPSISNSEKAQLIEKAFTGKVEPLTEDFLKVLVQRDRLEALRTINQSFIALRDEKEGRVYGTITTAVKLSDDQEQQVRNSVCESLGKDVILTCEVDPDIIGGMTLKIGNKFIDGSILKSLKSVAAALRSQKLADMSSIIEGAE